MGEWKVAGFTELKALGSGGFGAVVLARHDVSGTPVAIKYLHAGLLADSGFVQMFRAEAAVLSSLADPNVVRLYEYLESPAGAAIVMELVDGVSLREILTRQGRTTAEAALMVLQGSLLGLAAAHRRGVVHRDFKPENVLVAGDGVSKLTDFGIAARAGDSPMPAGTLAYAPQEQFAGGPASPAGDVYAATATFYECLTGRPPFSGPTAEALMYQHMSQPVPLEPVPAPLRSLVEAGMAKEPGRRPADGIALVTELKRIAGGTYGPDWEHRGRSHLGEAALLLAALWPSGAAPPVQGTAVHTVPLRRRLLHPHISGAKAAIAAGIVVAGAAAGTVLALSGSHHATGLAGTWTGTYVCSQGETGLRLAIQEASDGALTATFHFFAVPANPGVPSGSFTMTGTDSHAGMRLVYGHWIKRPAGYEMVDLSAPPPSNGGDRLSGTVTLSGCTTFTVTRSTS
jgi:eukaryotic-like serine/threonine-protein kinase